MISWVEERSWLLANLLRIPVRLAQFFAGLATGYAATYQVQFSNVGFSLGIQAIAVTTAIAWILEWRIGAGWWATLLGLAIFGVLLLPSLLMPACPSESGACATPGTRAFSLALIVMAAGALVLLLRRRTT